jgi:hypothetical protein
LANAGIARQLVNRAIDDWESVISNFNYTEDTDSDPNNNLNNTFTLNVIAALPGQIPGRGRTEDVYFPNGRPVSANIFMDDNGEGSGWLFDTTPLDDAEFTAIANSGSSGTGAAFHASFVDSSTSGTRYNDFYRTIVHEIGHAMGLLVGPAGTPLATSSAWMSFSGTDTMAGGGQLYTFHRPGSQFDTTATLTTNGGGHIYEVNHPNELMNPGRTVPAGSNPRETTRQFISDLDVQILADAYGYSVVLPSTLNTAHASLDSQTGTLLVQGGVNSQGFGQFDSIIIDTIDAGATIRVRVNNTTELFQTALVRQIVIAQNGGADSQTVTGITVPVANVQYVVSSNQDSAIAGALADQFVDLDTNVPGSQVSLRAAIRDINGMGAGSARSIYVPRGTYGLTISGPDPVDTIGDPQGDLDIARSITIIGTGAGETVIDAAPLRTKDFSDRVFNVVSGAVLNLKSLTVTGGRAPADEYHGGGIYVRGGGTLYLDSVAVVENQAWSPQSNGAGIYFAEGAGGIIVNSVITGNSALGSTGGVYLASTSPPFAGVSIGTTIIAKNTAPTGTPQDVYATSNRPFTSLGYNRLTTGASGFINGTYGDYIDSHVDYVVTGIADTFNSANDYKVLSIRDAVHAANTAAAGTHEIWLPAWNFKLTIQRTALPNQVEMSVAQGDLDIEQSLIVRGINSGSVKTSVAWRPGAPNDAVFDLLGDYNGDGVTSPDSNPGNVDSADYATWRYYDTRPALNDFRADGNDDGDVNQADYDIWRSHYGNSLTLIDVAV